MNKSDIIPSVEVKTDYNSWHSNSSEELPYQQPCNSFLPESKNSMWRTQTHTHTRTCLGQWQSCSSTCAQAGGSVAQVLTLANPEANPSNTAQKPTPWANPIPPYPHTWKRDFQVIAQVTDCLGLTGAAARCRSQKMLGSPCKGFVLELFMDQPELFFNQPELLNQPELFINWPGLFINWAELACKLARPHADPEFLNLPGPDVFILINSACRVFKFKMCTSWAWSGFAKLSFCCITMTGTPYGTNAQLPGPWFNHLTQALCSHRYFYTIQSTGLAVRP